jgi:hypothetical protein
MLVVIILVRIIMMMMIIHVCSRRTRARNWPFFLSRFYFYKILSFSLVALVHSFFFWLFRTKSNEMRMCTCLRSIWIRSTWPSSFWPLCSYSLSYEYLHAQHSHQTLVVVWSLTLYIEICSLFYRVADQMTIEYIWVHRERRNYRTDDRQHTVMTFFFFCKLRIRKKRIGSIWPEKN